MRFVCQRESFLAAYQTASAFAPQRSPKAILQNVKLELGSDGTSGTLIATDSELGIRVQVQDLEIEATGQAVLPAGRFGMVLRESNDDKLRIESDGTSLVVSGERSVIRLPAQNPDEFPGMAEVTDPAYFSIPVPLFKTLIHRTAFATDVESSRFALGGVLLEIDDERITAVGTDGRRLAKMEGPVTAVGGAVRLEQNTIVPTRALQLIERALNEDEGTIALILRPNACVVKTPSRTIFTRLVEGRFPRWRDVLPDIKQSSAVELTVGPLYSALRQAAIVTDKESKGIDFVFSPGSLILTGRTANVGQTRVELPIAYDGPAVTMCLDNVFMSDFLRVLDLTSTFTIHFQSSESAAMCITPDGYNYVVMPLSRDHVPA